MLHDITVTTGQDAVFEVELSHVGVAGAEWWLGDNLLQNNDLNEMSCEGRVHRLALRMVTTDECGDVAFVLGEEKSVACLLVEEKPKGKGDEPLLQRPSGFIASSCLSCNCLSWPVESTLSPALHHPLSIHPILTSLQ